VRWQPVSPTLMGRLIEHGRERHAPPGGQLLRYASGRPITYRRYNHLWTRVGRHLPWVRTQQISMHWIRHTTLTWVERNFGYAVARAYAGHTRRAMSEADYAALITAAHRYLNAPVIMIWHNLSTHLSRKMQAFTTAHPDWLTVIQLPACAPDLNPVEGAWPVMKNGLGNLAAGTTDQLAAAMRHQLDRIQQQHSLITGFLGQTGLSLEPEPP
jgi:DDE superfamily endonuclease